MEFLKKTTEALKTGLRTLMPSCRQVARIQSDALERPLGVSQRLGMWLHLLVCKWCRRYGRQIRFLSHAAQEHSDDLTGCVPQNLPAEARQRIKQRLRSQGK